MFEFDSIMFASQLLIIQFLNFFGAVSVTVPATWQATVTVAAEVEAAAVLVTAAAIQ